MTIQSALRQARSGVVSLAKEVRRSKPFVADRNDGPLWSYMDRGIGTVEGWLGPDLVYPLERLAAHQGNLGIGGGAAEIGVHHGQLFILLALLTNPGENSLAVDLFDDQEANTDGSGLGDREQFEANMAKASVDADRVMVRAMNSYDLTPEMVRQSVGGGVRLFSVDGGHTPELTINDLDVAEASLVDGGIIILDDVFSSMWPGVIQGTWDWIHRPERKVVPFALLGNKTMFTSPAQAETYRAVLEVFREGVHHRNDHLWGNPVTILKA